MAATLKALQKLASVTRVARVTGLDRAGIEVACAVRPLGHVLQVSNGKGLKWADAATGAVMEALELHAAEHPPAQALTFASQRELGETAWGALDLGCAAASRDLSLWSKDYVYAWVRAKELFSGGEVQVPAQAIYCPPRGTVNLGPVFVGWTTNGMGAHATADGALLHALLEATERDQLKRSATYGFTFDLVMHRRIADATLPPKVKRLTSALAGRGFDVALFDLTPDADANGAVGLPVAGALLFDSHQGAIPLTAGYACRLSPEDALVSALLEAAQSRLTDIHGARDDIVAPDHRAAHALHAQIRSTGGRRDARRMPRQSGGVRGVLRQLRRAGFTRAAAVTLMRDPAHVVKVVVPGLILSELLL